MHLLENDPFCVVIAEAELGRGTWRELLDRLQGRTAPRLIVASRFADECLWSEVLNRGGYDVLAKPFDPKEVSWVVRNAWRDWAAHKDPAS